MAQKRVRAVVQGRVQGVFFRQCAFDKAMVLGLSGWVRNLSNGSVETEFQGESENVAEMQSWLYQGSPMSLVTQVEIVDQPVDENDNVFRVLY